VRNSDQPWLFIIKSLFAAPLARKTDELNGRWLSMTGASLPQARPPASAGTRLSLLTGVRKGQQT